MELGRACSAPTTVRQRRRLVSLLEWGWPTRPDEPFEIYQDRHGPMDQGNKAPGSKMKCAEAPRENSCDARVLACVSSGLAAYVPPQRFWRFAPTPRSRSNSRAERP